MSHISQKVSVVDYCIDSCFCSPPEDFEGNFRWPLQKSRDPLPKSQVSQADSPWPSVFWQVISASYDILKQAMLSKRAEFSTPQIYPFQLFWKVAPCAQHSQDHLYIFS